MIEIPHVVAKKAEMFSTARYDFIAIKRNLLSREHFCRTVFALIN